MKKSTKPFILMTGMHRSGTSFLARALNLSGVSLGVYNSLVSTDWTPLKDNPRGHWENKEILELSKKTLAVNKGSWEKIPKKITIKKSLGTKIKKCVDQICETPLLAAGFKEPRIIFIFEAWKKYLPKNPVIIGIFRHPLKVAESLKTRDGFEYEKSIELWKIYNEKLLALLDKQQGFLLDFDWPQKKMFAEIKKISHKLGLIEDVDLSEWYTKDLFRADKTFDSKYKLTKDVQKLYSKLKNKSNQNSKVKIKSFTKIKKSEIPKMLLKENQIQDSFFRKIYQDKDKIIKEKDLEIGKPKEDFQKMISSQDKIIGEKNAEIEKQKEDFQKMSSSQDKIIGEKNAEIEKQKEDFQKMKDAEDKIIKEKDLEIIKIKNDFKEKDEEIIKIKNDFKEKDEEIIKIKNSFKEKDEEIGKLKEDFQKMKDAQDRLIKENDEEIGKLKEDFQKMIDTQDKIIREKDLEIVKMKELDMRVRTNLTKVINKL